MELGALSGGCGTWIGDPSVKEEHLSQPGLCGEKARKRHALGSDYCPSPPNTHSPGLVLVVEEVPAGAFGLQELGKHLGPESGP